MKGVKCVFDDAGDIDTVIIDVKKHRKLREDIQDILIARERRKETPVPFEEVKERLREKRKLP